MVVFIAGGPTAARIFASIDGVDVITPAKKPTIAALTSGLTDEASRRAASVSVRQASLLSR